MTSTNLADQLPIGWHGLFAALQSPRDGLRRAELWLQHSSSSQLNESPQWQSLLSCLTQPQPRHHTASLTFLPLFCLLAPDLQIKLLSVIHHHRQQICSSSLKTFVRVVYEHTEVGTWQRILCDMLKRCLAEPSAQGKETDWTLTQGKETDLSLTERNEPDLKETHYDFTQANAALADLVCQELLSSYSVQPWQTNLEVGITGITSKGKNNIPPLADTPASESSSVEDPDPVIACVTEDKGVVRDMIVLDEDDGVQDSPPAKRAKQHVSTEEETTKDKSDVPVDKALQEKAGWLRELLQDSSLTDLDVTELNFMAGLPAYQLKLLCGMVNVSSLPDECLVTAFELLTRISTAVSYSSCVAFISGCFIPKFSELDHPASRTLAGVLKNLAESFPKQLIDAVTADTHTISHMTSSQSDVLCRLCKESFNAECQVYLLRSVLSVCGEMTEPTVPVVGCVLESLDRLDEATLSILLDSVHNSAHSLANSLKFGKLLFSFVSKHGKSLSATQVSVLFQVAELHKTFMKKSVLAALRRISK